MAQHSASVMSELTQQSGSLTRLASDDQDDTILGGLRHSPPGMKNQNGLNEGKKHIGKKIISQLSACDVTRVVSLDTNNQV